MGNITNEKFQTGNRVLAYARGDGVRALIGDGIVGAALGEATSTSMSGGTGAQPLHVLGSADPVENVHGRHTYSVRLSLLRLVSREAADMVNAGDIELDCIDRYTGKAIATAEGCTLSDWSLDLSASQPVARNLSFLALRIK